MSARRITVTLTEAQAHALLSAVDYTLEMAPLGDWADQSKTYWATLMRGVRAMERGLRA